MSEACKIKHKTLDRYSVSLFFAKHFGFFSSFVFNRSCKWATLEFGVETVREIEQKRNNPVFLPELKQKKHNPRVKKQTDPAFELHIS